MRTNEITDPELKTNEITDPGLKTNKNTGARAGNK